MQHSNSRRSLLSPARDEAIISIPDPTEGAAPGFRGSGCAGMPSLRWCVDSTVREENKQVDTIIDLDRQEILNILRDVQEHSVYAEYGVQPATDPDRV
jgi:hypothetical protein